MNELEKAISSDTACPVIASLVCVINDCFSVEDRKLLLPFASKIANSKTSIDKQIDRAAFAVEYAAKRNVVDNHITSTLYNAIAETKAEAKQAADYTMLAIAYSAYVLCAAYKQEKIASITLELIEKMLTLN